MSIELEKIKQTMLIKLNRPDVYNALNKDAKDQIVKAIKDANKDNDIRSIILTANGKAFCTGQDLNDRTIQTDNGPVDLGNTLEQEWVPLVNAIKNSKKMVIAGINGVCAGAGLSVALACDLIVAKPNVKFISGFSKLGLVPDAGSSYTFSRAMGYQKTLEFFLFNNPITSEELLGCGLINDITEELSAKTLELAEKVNALAPQSVEFIKKNVQFGMESSFKETLQREVQAQRFLGNSLDYQEGLKAFFEKRPPNFQGK